MHTIFSITASPSPSNISYIDLQTMQNAKQAATHLRGQAIAQFWQDVSHLPGKILRSLHRTTTITPKAEPCPH